jgi:hypothetical protein
MWRTLLVTAWPRRGCVVPSGAQAAEAARVARTGALAALAEAPGAMFAADAATASAIAPHAASATHSVGMVSFKAVAPFDGDALVCTDLARAGFGMPSGLTGEYPKGIFIQKVEYQCSTTS